MIANLIAVLNKPICPQIRYSQMLRRVPCTPGFQPENIFLWDSAFIAGSSESSESTSPQYGNDNRKKNFSMDESFGVY